MTATDAPRRSGAQRFLRPHRAGPRSMALRVLAALALGILVGLTHFLVAPPEYSASTLVSVVPKRVGPQQAPMQSLQQVRYSQALARVAMTDQVAATALRAAGLADMAQAPKRSLTTSAAPDTAVFTITGRSSSAQQAVQAVSAVASGIQMLAKERALPVVVVYDEPTSSHEPSPRLLPRVVLGGSIGLAAGVIWVLLLLDHRWTQPRPGLADSRPLDKENP